MPTYEYECSACGHRFEVIQSMSDKPIERCPECGKKVRRLIYGGMGVIFKGSGFYSTDNRSGTGSSKRTEESTPSTEKSSPAPDSAKTKDSTSATKKEPAKSKS